MIEKSLQIMTLLVKILTLIYNIVKLLKNRSLRFIGKIRGKKHDDIKRKTKR